MDPDQEFLTKAEFTRNYVDALVTVATAVLVLSVTFLKNINSAPIINKTYLEWSWGLFTGAIISGIVYRYVLILLVNAKSCWPANVNCTHKLILKIVNLLLHLFFFTAVACFLFFALKNT